MSILQPSASICIPCRGAKFLCGRSYCPVLIKNIKLVKNVEISKRIIEGSSPPSVFVGRINYPRITVGPLVPSFFGDTRHFDYPEAWNNLRIEDILNYRLSLVRCYRFVKVESVEDPYILSLHELALSYIPVDMRVELKKNPSKLPLFDDVMPPLGPSSLLNRYEILSNIKSDKVIEKVYYDKDLRANESVIKLYNKNVELSRIVKVFSLGMLGIKKNRKLVPTRWSITAVDDIISKDLIKKIKQFNTIDKPRVFIYNKFMNNFVIILLPYRWFYEWIEAWYPKTTWNLYGEDVEVESDHELGTAKTRYSNLGGCYYAVRLAVSEYLLRERRQAAVLAIREILPGFITSIGVWFVRETLREIFRKNEYKEFEDVKDAINYALNFLVTNKEKIINSSYVLKYLLKYSTFVF
jgi:hypothetical protein